MQPAETSAWVRRFLPAIRAQGRILDLAAGAGRHSLLARQLGFEVVAADRETSDLSARFAGDPACRIITIDLEADAIWRLGGGFDGIIVTNYLHRPLFPDLATALAPGGVLIYETFLQGNERFGKPTNPAFLLQRDELLDAFRGRLAILAFEQGVVALPRPAAIQRLAAIKGALGALP
jgi:SAM-dependent methyltransferase